ncbi:hypothetical protein PTSG_00870 [Salpingoeca rosetta]|uniref:Nucleotide exchange factor Fes1 domain-containing protein n=1 Tax=Salpingoeca rosetta (strain ATCC 50818 / BSB-021) TaxID=946362 RepID=F2TXQ4_SALR5|nr:uncharacterized protein PTSG_00870 [Salpingoeca rosetta]EGD76163.1 hypothetical protein PTSG_00870 [Salpingoeca rosetta]|eukprot:XP_004998338.1 hypothetical protein PTSG_00870 [Salpingoeca rosetta]
MSLVPVQKDEEQPQPQPQPQPQQPAGERQPVQHNHRHDTSLQGVLSWVIEETAGSGDRVVPQSEEAATSTAQNLDEDRRVFLEKFLGNLTGRDHMSAVKDALSTLLSGSDASEEDKHEALETISDEVEDINIAHDFLAINGLATIQGSLQNPSPEFQWRAAEILAHLAQNNPKAQAALAEADLLPRVLTLLSASDHNTVRLKALSALSAMVRGSDTLMHTFLQQPNAIQHTLHCLRHPTSSRLQIKTVVFLRHLVREQPSVAATLFEPASLALIANALTADADDQLWEHDMHLLSKLYDSNNALVSRIEAAEPAFPQMVDSRRRTIMALPQEDKDAHREELQHMQALFGDLQL